MDSPCNTFQPRNNGPCKAKLSIDPNTIIPIAKSFMDHKYLFIYIYNSWDNCQVPILYHKNKIEGGCILVRVAMYCVVSITSTEGGNTISRAVSSLGPKIDRNVFWVSQELLLLLSTISFKLIKISHTDSWMPNIVEYSCVTFSDFARVIHVPSTPPSSAMRTAIPTVLAWPQKYNRPMFVKALTLLNWVSCPVFMPCLSPVYSFLPGFFWGNLIPCVTKQGVLPVPCLFLTLWITWLSIQAPKHDTQKQKLLLLLTEIHHF